MGEILILVLHNIMVGCKGIIFRLIWPCQFSLRLSLGSNYYLEAYYTKYIKRGWWCFFSVLAMMMIEHSVYHWSKPMRLMLLFTTSFILVYLQVYDCVIFSFKNIFSFWKKHNQLTKTHQVKDRPFTTLWNKDEFRCFNAFHASPV